MTTTTAEARDALEALKARYKGPGNCSVVGRAERDPFCECLICLCDRVLDYLDVEGVTYEQGILKVVARARALAFREAAKLSCSYCNSNNPWSDAKVLREGDGYEHYALGDCTNKRPCASGVIWKQADSEDPGRTIEARYMELRRKYGGRLWMGIDGSPTQISVEMFPPGSDMVIGEGLWRVSGTYYSAMEKAIERCKLDENKEAEEARKNRNATL